MISRHPILLLLCAAVFLHPRFALADYRVPLQPPAGALSKTVRVEVGHEVEIVLEARGNGGRDVTFIMRDAPKRGKLSGMQKLQPGKARVIYKHNSRKGPGVDYFRYAVQLSGSPVSAAGTITIEAVDSGPRLEFPLLLDFGQVTLGEQPEQVIELTNTGGGLVSGGVAAEAPFQVVGEALFQVGPRGKSQVRVRFSPTAVGEFTGNAVVSAVGGGHIELIGSCIVPFVITPGENELACDAEGIRAGRFLIRSYTEDELVCSLTYEGPITGPPELRLSPLDSSSFDVWARESETAGGKGKVTIRAGSFEKTLDLQVAPAGARLKVGPMSSIDLGEILPGSDAGAEIWIENSGGERGIARISAQGLLEPAPETVAVDPGERRSLRLKWREEAGGPSTRRIEVLPEGANVPMVVELRAKFPTLKQAVAVRVPAAEASEPKVAETARVEPGQAVEEDPDLAVIQHIDLTKRTETTLELKWKAPPGAASYVTELLVFEKVDGKPRPVWKEVQPDDLKMQDGYALMQLKDLDAGSLYKLRLRVKNSLGGVSAPSPEVTAVTLVRRRWNIPWTGITIAVLLGAAGWMLYLRYTRG